MTQRHTIELTESELIVLNAVLDRLEGRDDFETLVPDQADRQAIHNLVCLLERVDPIVVAGNYDEQLALARDQVLSEP